MPCHASIWNAEGVIDPGLHRWGVMCGRLGCGRLGCGRCGCGTAAAGWVMVAAATATAVAEIEFLFDTGATVTLMNHETFQMLRGIFGILINRIHAVEREVRTQQHRQREDLYINVLIPEIK